MRLGIWTPAPQTIRPDPTGERVIVIAPGEGVVACQAQYKIGIGSAIKQIGLSSQTGGALEGQLACDGGLAEQ